MPAAPAHWAADVVLADGGAAHVRPIRPEDAPLLQAFHSRLSPESIYLRFFSPKPRLSAEDVRRFTNVDHDARVALAVWLGDELIAIGRYDRAVRGDSAEVAFVVDDEHQGRGIASLLLERLASAAMERGIGRFTADVLPQNRSMLRVFHDAGFEATSRFEDGIVRVSFPIARTPEALAAAAERERTSAARSVARLLSPRGIGVVAEGPEADPGEALLRRLESSGFSGVVRRLPASEPSGDFEGIDLVALAVAPERLALELERCGARGVHAALVLERGRLSDEALAARGDRALAARARREGLRLVGPASLGVARMVGAGAFEALSVETPIAPGRIGVFVESPRRGRELLRAAIARGIGLSTFVSAGRKADLSASDVLQFFEEDPETEVVALVVRSLGNPRQSAAIARRVARKKPILVWLADLREAPPAELLDALAEHTGTLRCEGLDDLCDLAEAALAPRSTRRSRGASERLAAWRRWKRSAPERLARPDGIERSHARGLVDAELAASPLGALLARERVETLLAHYGLRTEGFPRGAELRVRIEQSSTWGSFVVAEADRTRVTKLVPLDERDVHTLASVGGTPATSAILEALRRIAALAFDLPELASLEMAIPAEGPARIRVVGDLARLAPWTLGLAFSEAGDDAMAPPGA
ncbi:Peptidyl-lysine N-acetyltransferase PatZ [Myxococcaceae bacterium]|nr:Peptidyl-lysine N-acetyltransferase PatZ [Myxococcaceae bacterium]